MNTKKITGIMLFVFMLLTGYMALGDEPAKQSADWRDISLKDVRTGRTFTIADFKGKTVILETFAVWCPTCTKQQREIKQLHSEIGDEFISITLDVDPNESEEKVKEHLKRNGFDWLYAIAPPELTKLLIDEFGTVIVNAPSAPVVLISEDGDARLLGRGVKSAEKLKAEIKKRG
jgi:cytochrome oxidase Cu insertion factor (SCO1/SenC/PrrC family)